MSLLSAVLSHERKDKSPSKYITKHINMSLIMLLLKNYGSYEERNFYNSVLLFRIYHTQTRTFIY
jgi:hypothetical protein